MSNLVRKDSGRGLVFGIAVILLIIGIVIVNQWLNQQFRQIQREKDQAVKVPSPRQAPTPRITKKESVETTRQMYLDPNREFYVSIFSQDGAEIARCKSKGEEIYDMTGEIPDGKVKFVNDTENTSGEEYYLNGKRHGWYREYYSKGQLKRETKYVAGQVMTNSEYFLDGILRMEQDYTDAILLTEEKIEIGVGKVYSRDGKLRYEWRLTNRDQGGYKKSYNSNGELVAVDYFNAYGELIKAEKKQTNNQ